MTAIINQLLPEPHAGLLAGILFGTKATFTKDLYDALIVTGTLHIAALSGMNITILTGLVGGLLIWVFSKRVSSLLTIGIIWWFVFFVGASPSIVRAAIMGCITLLAVVYGRQYWAILTWILAVVSMLLLNFNWIADLSFQLSALATLGIILFNRKRVEATTLAWGDRNFLDPLLPSTSLKASAPKVYPELVEGLGKRSAKISFPLALHPFKGSTFKGVAAQVGAFLWRGIYEELHLTLSAQVFTIPLILWYFHRISLISPLANVAIGWSVPLITGAGWIMLAVAAVWLPAGRMVAWAAWILLEYLLRVVMLLYRVPLASIGG